MKKYSCFLLIFLCLAIQGCEIRDNEILKLNEDTYEESMQCYENSEENEMDIQGSIYCAEDRTIMEINDNSEIIWTETILTGEKKYEITFKRIGSPYEGAESFSLGLLSDYQLLVQNEDGTVLQELAMTDYPIRYEDVHWIKDISQNGFPDIIFCTDFISMPYCDTRLRFFIWNEQNQMYDCQNLPDEYVRHPIWNEELGTVMFWKEGSNKWIENMKMYLYDTNHWELYGEILLENNDDIPDFTNTFQEEMYYTELKYTIKEIFYQDGEVIQETVLEESPWWNPDSIWYLDNEKNELFYPEKDWEKISNYRDIII